MSRAAVWVAVTAVSKLIFSIGSIYGMHNPPWELTSLAGPDQVSPDRYRRSQRLLLGMKAGGQVPYSSKSAHDGAEDVRGLAIVIAF